MRQSIKKLTPAPVWQLGSNTYWWWRNRGRHVLARSLSSHWVESTRKLHHLENIHKDKRCFIIGNGPSLRHTDLNKLRGEYTFGLNRIYLLFPELDFSTTYLVSVNDLVLKQSAEEMRSLDLLKFLTWRSRHWFHGDSRVIYLATDFTGDEDFCSKITGRIFEGFTVTYVALQLAYYMGFEKVILVGVDHNFVTKGAANQAIVSQGA